jgi:ribosomal protein S13
MKFEQLLQIYWSRGFLYGGKVRNFNINLITFFDENSGLSKKSKKSFLQRFELNFFLFDKEKTFLHLSLDQRKIINMYLSQLISINNSIFELIKYNLIRLYLIKTFRGRCHLLGKPARGQRTWSNASTSYRVNRVIRVFIRQVKKNNVIEKKTESLNTKITKKKLKKNLPKIKMVFTKKKKKPLILIVLIIYDI